MIGQINAIKLWIPIVQNGFNFILIIIKVESITIKGMPKVENTNLIQFKNENCHALLHLHDWTIEQLCINLNFSLFCCCWFYYALYLAQWSKRVVIFESDQVLYWLSLSSSSFVGSNTWYTIIASLLPVLPLIITFVTFTIWHHCNTNMFCHL